MKRLSGAVGMLKKNEPSAPGGDCVTYRPLAFESDVEDDAAEVTPGRCESTATAGSLPAS